MGQTEEDYQIQEDAAGGVKRKKKKTSTRRGNSIGKRNTSHSGSKGHKQERFASTTSSRYMLAPDANVKQSPSVEEAQFALLHSMFQLGDDEEIMSVKLEDRVAFSLSDEGVRNGASSAIFFRGFVDDGEEHEIKSRAKRRSFMGFVIERAVSLLISPRFHFNLTNLSFEQHRWGRAVTDCSAAWFEKMDWRLRNFESIPASMKSSIRNTIELAKLSNGNLSRYQSLRDEGGHSRCYAMQTTELLHLFCRHESYLVNRRNEPELVSNMGLPEGWTARQYHSGGFLIHSPRRKSRFESIKAAKDYLGIVPEIDPAELELASNMGLPDGWTARKKSKEGGFIIYSADRKRRFESIKAAKDYLGIVREVDPAELELASNMGLPDGWTARKRKKGHVFYSPGRSGGWPSKKKAFERAKWLSQSAETLMRQYQGGGSSRGGGPSFFGGAGGA